jgi:hypothetical protein
MSLLDAIIRFIRRLFSLSPRVQKASRERNTLEQDTGKQTIHVALYQTRELSKMRGRTPEQSLALFLAQAIAEAGFDYRIEYGYEETYRLPYQNNSVDNYDWWAENSPERAANSNILLYDGRGGRAGIGGPNGIVGQADVTRLYDEAHTPCDSDSCGNMWSGIHELGHNLGGRHSTPMMQDKPDMLFHENMVELLNERAESGEMA